MDKVIVDNKEYRVIKEYPNFVLVKDKSGFKTCFSAFDLGLIEKRHVEREANVKWG